MKASRWQPLVRRYREFQQIGRDPVLMVGLLISSSFVFLFVVWPLLRVVRDGFFDFNTGAFSLEYFDRYIDPYFARHSWTTLRDTMVMGVAAATGGTLLGFIFAYTLVRCNYPFSRAVHAFSLIPTISPPFAIAMAVILLFGRAGLVTRDWLGMTFEYGTNDIYGLDGLVFVQVITFFPVAYLIMRAMLERLDPAMEEAAQSLGASKLRIFRTVTVPLLVPGIAGSFLLLFVESLADLGNPLLLTGTRNVLSTEIFLAVNGEYNQQKAAALSFVLLIPTLTVFMLQRYWVSRRSYISVTGKPTGGQLQVREWYIRWPFMLVTTAALILIAALYFSIAFGSITRLWGVDYSLSLSNYKIAFSRGIEAILDTTFLSAVATPIAGILGMIIAFLVVRREFSGKETLDFVSNLGAAVPGTILGIGFIIAFIGVPWPALFLIFSVFLLYLLSKMEGTRKDKLLVAAIGVVVGGALAYYAPLLGSSWMIAIVALGLTFLLWLLGRWSALPDQRRLVSILLLFPMIGLLLFAIGPYPTSWLGMWGRSMGGNAAKVLTSLADWVDVFTQIPLPAHGLLLLAIGGFVLGNIQPQRQRFFTTVLLAIGALLIFTNKPLA
ncbi:MAG: iron ABC transporter permease, partial [Chloroflexi bacterium]|nr:iron ABC transporter permease [Chloroflexota bacterium]